MKNFIALFAFLNLKSHPFWKDNNIILVPTREDHYLFLSLN